MQKERLKIMYLGQIRQHRCVMRVELHGKDLKRNKKIKYTMKARICTFYFLDSLIIFVWLSLVVFMFLGGIITAFPALGQALATENTMLILTMTFFIASAVRFLEAFYWNSLLVMPGVYALVIVAYWLLLNSKIIRTYPASLFGSSIVPACVIAVFLPGLDYVWQKIKPRGIVSAGSLVREQMRLRRKREGANLSE